MSQPKYAPLNGDFAIKSRGTAGALSALFNATTGNLNMTVTQETVKSNGNESGTIATFETERSASLEVTLHSRHVDNLKMLTLANSIEVAAGVAVAITVPEMLAGQIVPLGIKNVTTLTLGTLVDGVDYKLYPKTGMLRALVDCEADTGTASHGKYTKLGVFSADAGEYEIHFFSEKTGQSYEFYNGKASPSGALTLIQDGNGIGTATLVFELQQDLTAPNDGTLGQYGRAYDVS
jgi:hypothetical protein